MKIDIRKYHRNMFWMVLIILAAAPILQAQRGMRPCLRADGSMRSASIMNLDLSEEQTEYLQALRLEKARALRPLRNELNENLAQRRTLMNSEEFDRDAVFTNIDERTNLQNQIGKVNAEYHAKFRNTLTDDQKLMLILKGEQSRHRYSGMHGMRMGQMKHPHFRMGAPERRPMHRFRYRSGSNM